MNYRDVLGQHKPVIGMLHLKADGTMGMLARAQTEARNYLENGVDALLVENYFGSTADCETVLQWLHAELPGALYGVNILGDMANSFRLCNRYGGRFLQIDSVSGHLAPKQDAAFGQELSAMRQDSAAVVLGGVRFKYQPVASGRTLQEDLQIGMERCDAIVVTGEGTGMATPMEKVSEFRRHAGAFPLVVGAGITLKSLADTLLHGDGMIVGSYFKDEHQALGDVNRDYLHAFMEQKRQIQIGTRR